MKKAEISHEESKYGTLYIDGLKAGNLTSDAIMDDSGLAYFAKTINTEGEVLDIIWDTTDDWDNGHANMEDESEACDWDKFVVLDESGEQIAEAGH